jgi:uncharacterized damage-inducible protein DinB
MSQPSLTAEEVLAWLESTSARWRKFVEDDPEVLTMSCDIAGASTVGALLQHIVAVELRYAERLAGLPATDYANISFDSATVLYATHDRAIALLREQLASSVDWNERIAFPTRTMGQVRSSRKTILFHAMLHGIRHYAQLASLVRQHGFKTAWPMDYLPMDMERVEG